MSSHASDVFREHFNKFTDLLDLEILAPHLYSKNLLSHQEYEAVLYEPHLPYNRKLKLLGILRSKGETAIPEIVQCLRDAGTHLGHNELADLIERFREQSLIANQDSESCMTIESQSSTQSSILQNYTTLETSRSGAAHSNMIFSNSDYLCGPTSVSVSVPSPSSFPSQNIAGDRKGKRSRLPPLVQEDDSLTPHYTKRRKRDSSDCYIHDESQSQECLSFKNMTPMEFSQQYIPRQQHTCIPQDTPQFVTSKFERQVTSQPALNDSLTEDLKILADTLRGTYTSDNFFQLAAGPSIENIKFINLALVKKEEVSENDKEQDIFLKNTLHGSIDDIVKKKEKISLEEIFQYGDKCDKLKRRKIVLVEGAPGVGKTMLAMKLCQEWANGRLLQEYNLVMLIQLRRFQGSTEITVEDLIRVSLGKSKAAENASHDILKKNDKVLLILEGWDELPPKLRNEGSFFFDIVNAIKLPHASVLVTSRPSVTSSLYRYMNERHIEVLGFKLREIEKYVKQHTNKAKARVVLDHLKQFPNLQALAHIPLTLAVICNIMKSQQKFPPTLTELYERHICNTVYQKLKCHVSSIQSLDKLEGNAKEVIRSLSKLALNGITERAMIFTSRELLDIGLEVNAGFDGFGLLSTFQIPTTAGRDCCYQFRHLSIQEFLAAYHIKELNCGEKVQLLREFRKDKPFQHVWKFLAGITKLKDEKLCDLIVSKTSQANFDQLFLLHCLYEAHDTNICQVAAAKIKHVINLSNISLNTTDCLCVAYVITEAGGEWEVDLRGANIGEDGLAVFKSHILHHLDSPDFDQTDLKITVLDLTHNQITNNAVCHLADILKSNLHIQQLRLESNKIGDRRIGELVNALNNNHTLTNLRLTRCGLTSDGARRISNMLEKNNSLKQLTFGYDYIGDEGTAHIACALKKNQTLQELALTNIGLSVEGLKPFAEMMEVNTSLEIVRLSRNKLGPEGCTPIAEIVLNNDRVVLIDLSKNPIGDEGFEIILDALMKKPRSSLTKLGVFGCKITCKSLSKLVDFFTVTETFSMIQLGCNSIGDEAVELIGEALQKNKSKSVKTVLLESTNVSEQGKAKLESILKSLERESDDIKINYTKNSVVSALRDERNSHIH